MSKKLTYDMLSDEDKLLMDGLFQAKKHTIKERVIIRNIISSLRSLEMKKTKEIMSLSQKSIGEKFELGANSAKQLTKRNRENLKNRVSKEKIKSQNEKYSPIKTQQNIMKKINEKKTCSENRQQSSSYSGGFTKDPRYYC